MLSINLDWIFESLCWPTWRVSFFGSPYQIHFTILYWGFHVYYVLYCILVLPDAEGLGSIVVAYDSGSVHSSTIYHPYVENLENADGPHSPQERCTCERRSWVVGHQEMLPYCVHYEQTRIVGRK